MTDAEILDRLRASGYRLTAPRRALVEALLTAGQPLTAEDLHQRVRAGGMNLSTVYRNLTMFCAMGWLDAAPGLNGERLYHLAPARESAFSLLCLDCGKLNQMPPAPASGLGDAVRELGFKADSLRVTLAAHCEHKCDRRAEDEAARAADTGAAQR